MLKSVSAMLKSVPASKKSFDFSEACIRAYIEHGKATCAATQSMSNTKLPVQLASLIRAEEPALQDAGLFPLEKDVLSKAKPATQNDIVAAAKMRGIKELGSYTRAVAMRLGFAE